jgi:hypothetical protein
MYGAPGYYYGGPGYYGYGFTNRPSYNAGYGVGRAVGAATNGAGFYSGSYYGNGSNFSGPGYTTYYGGASVADQPSVMPGDRSMNRPMNLTFARQNFSGRPVSITYPGKTGPALQYLLNGTEHTIRPGGAATFVNDRRWIIQFDRGADNGTARYTLSDGIFKFKSTDHGWELVRAANDAQPDEEVAQPANPQPAEVVPVVPETATPNETAPK